MSPENKSKIAKALRAAYAFIEFKCKQDGSQDWFNEKSDLGKQLQEALDLVEPLKQPEDAKN